jgi:hypothetical protein
VQQLPDVVALAPRELLAGLVPARRFGHASFETYAPDPRYPWQQQALHRMRSFSLAVDRRLSVSSTVPLPAVFLASYRHGGYEKKYRQCLCRLHELLSEAAGSPVGEGVAGQVELG